MKEREAEKTIIHQQLNEIMKKNELDMILCSTTPDSLTFVTKSVASKDKNDPYCEEPFVCSGASGKNTLWIRRVEAA